MSIGLQAQLQDVLGDAYHIERELGGAGMSHVFVAVERSLGRRVVVKLLSREMVGGVSEQRFLREINLTANLPHPHILPVLTAGGRDELLYYITPFLEGESLLERMKRGPVPVDEALSLLSEVADAISFAHARGIVHRDIKPGNILLQDGHAVLADFGIARAIEKARDPDWAATATGVIVGTPMYMSPESFFIRSEEFTRARDVYAFAVVAYEILAGVSPFPALTAQSIVQRRMPPRNVGEIVPGLPRATARWIIRALDVDPERRPEAATFKATLKSAPAFLTLGRKRAIAATAVVVVSAMFVASSFFGGTAPPRVVGTRVIAAAPELETDPSVSPDGKLVVYAGGALYNMRIFVRQLDGGGQPVEVTRGIAGAFRAPRWSPDGTEILFIQTVTDRVGGPVFSVSYTGGTPRRLLAAESTVVNAVWSPDGKRIVFSDGARLTLASPDGGERHVLATAPEIHSPEFSPSGDRIAYVSGDMFRTLILASNGASSIWTVATNGRTPAVRVTNDAMSNASPSWTPDGRAVFFLSNARGQTDLYRQRLSHSFSPAGPADRITTGLDASFLRLSPDGSRAVYGVARFRTIIQTSEFRNGSRPSLAPRIAFPLEGQYIEGLDVSPDGKWLVFDSDRSGNADIWKVGTAGGEPIRLTSDSAPDFLPSWSGDGERIAYYSMRGGNRDVRLMSKEGANDEPVTSSPLQEGYPGISPDGTIIAFVTSWTDAQTLVTTRRLPSGGWGDRRVLSARDAMGPRWSPGGQWVAYTTARGVEIAAPDLSNSRLVAPAADFVRRPRHVVWQSDSVLIVGTKTTNGVRAFYLLPVRTGRPHLLARFDIGLERPEFAFDGKRIFMTSQVLEGDIRLLTLGK